MATGRYHTEHAAQHAENRKPLSLDPGRVLPSTSLAQRMSLSACTYIITLRHLDGERLQIAFVIVQGNATGLVLCPL